MGAQADPEVYHWSSRSLTSSAECREASGCHLVTSRTLFDNRVLSCNIVIFLISSLSFRISLHTQDDSDELPVAYPFVCTRSPTDTTDTYDTTDTNLIDNTLGIVWAALAAAQ